VSPNVVPSAADALAAQLEARPSHAGAEIVAWRFELVVEDALRVGMQDGRIGGPYAPPGFGTKVVGGIDLRWSDGLRTRATLDRLVVDDLTDRLTEWRAAAYADRRAAPIPEPRAFPSVRTADPQVEDLVEGEPAPLFAVLGRARSELVSAGVPRPDASVRAARGYREVRSSADLHVAHVETSFSLSVSAEDLVEGRYAKRRVAHEEELGELCERVGRTVGRLRHEEALPPRPCPVLLTPEVVEGLVGRFLGSNLAGRSVIQGRSVFSLEDFVNRRKILRDDLSLIVDTTLPFELATSPCSAEGVPGGRVVLIEEGRLITPMLSPEDGLRAGLTPTPVPRRGPALLLESTVPGISFEAACERLGHGLIVSFLMGLHTGDARSGEYALVAPQAQVVSNGSVGGRARARVVGNVFRQLQNQSTRLVQFAHTSTPGLLLDGLIVEPA